jgi:hypothetical protein
MAFIKLDFKPGVNRDETNYSNEGGWWACDKVRFRSGSAEKIGGWQKELGAQFLGYVRQLWSWVTSYKEEMLALGSNEKVYIEDLGTYYDITPLRDTEPTFTTPNTNNCLSTTTGSNTITVTLPVAHLALTGDYVIVSGVTATSIGGIPSGYLNGNHKITVLTPTSFTFQSLVPATSTATAVGGTTIQLDFEISPGLPIATLGDGWGTSTWGRSTWSSGSLTGINLPQRDWWFDNFYNDLVMNIRNGEAYWWSRGSSSNAGLPLATKAISLSTYAYNTAIANGMSAANAQTYANAVPVEIGQLVMSQIDRHLIAFGAVPYGSTNIVDFDPMLIRWSDMDNPTEWTPDVLNSAGDIRLSRGSRIIRALSVRQETLVWTDTTLYTLQYLGTTDVYGVQEYADNVSMIGPRAAVTASGITYWMGENKFYAYTGRVETLPCTLRNYVFNNINRLQTDQIVCGTNEQYNEIWWFYPSATSQYNDSYVILNHLENIWYYGTMARTAWLDTPLRGHPLACNTPGGTDLGYLYGHEVAVDDDGSPMDSYIQSSDFDLGDGEQFMLTRRMIPDLYFLGSTVANPTLTMQIRPRNSPGAPMHMEVPDTQPVTQTVVGQYTQQVYIRARGRQIALRVESNTLGVQWQLGSPRLDSRADGRR